MSTNLPKVSVVTVTYNAEALLEETINSIIAQDYPNIEYIIIDGGSTDGTMEIIRKYEEDITQWISEPDRGIFDAMNKGVVMASGTWIGFMNAGDTFVSPHSISEVFDRIEPDTDFLCAGVYLVDEKSGDRYYQKPFGFDDISNSMIPCNHQGMFIKTKYMKEEPFDTHYLLAADYDLIVKNHLKGRKCQILTEPVSTFLLGGSAQQDEILLRIESLHIQAKYGSRSIALDQNYHFQNLLRRYPKSEANSLTRTQAKNFSIIFSQLHQQIEAIVDSDERLVIYGAGSVTQTFYDVLKEQIVCIVDLSKAGEKIGRHIVQRPMAMKRCPGYDKILITPIGREDEIMQYLSEDLCLDKRAYLRFSFH